ncbi:hypothetical protein ACH5RR_029803 [Cinchona calisaya]|uniref:Uncharacterized protein n=1 Tax=Cinchona calisaya TaxID=153742 RepID=A0ABD2YSS4_9GENT
MKTLIVAHSTPRPMTAHSASVPRSYHAGLVFDQMGPNPTIVKRPKEQVEKAPLATEEGLMTKVEMLDWQLLEKSSLNFGGISDVDQDPFILTLQKDVFGVISRRPGMLYDVS